MTSTPSDVALGQRLAAARMHAGLTIRQLAVQLGWPHTTLANYERGRRPLRVAQLIAIAQVLHQSPAAFLVGSPEAAAIINAVDHDLDRCLQVAFFLDSLDAGVEEYTPNPPANNGL